MTSRTPKPAASRRGRPSLARASAIDRLVVDVARERFLADGFDAVAMEQIAAAAGISKGTLYARHASKEALFSAVIEASVQDWSNEASRHDHLLGDDIEERLRHHIRTILCFLHNPEVRGLQRLLMSVRSRFPELAGIMDERGYRYMLALLVRDIEEAGGRDDMPPRDAEAVGRMLLATLSGYMLQEDAGVEGGAGTGVEQRMNAFGERVVDVVMAGRAAW